jgi:AhpD family alkylhydroperoxidase
MKQFNRRLYSSLGELLADFRMVMSNRKNIRAMMHSETFTPAFRERLFLAVTQVNGCRYCSYFHAQQALTEGISETEIRAIGDGLFDKCPAEELTALCYAQHWAETNAKPTPEARARLLETYGEETVAQMDLALRMIRIGNLTGNLLDYILFRLSFGRIDINKPPKMGRVGSR